MTAILFPGDKWQRKPPAEVGIDVEKLKRARRWLDDRARDPCYRGARLTFGRYHRGTWTGEEATGERYRVVIVRGGAVLIACRADLERPESRLRKQGRAGIVLLGTPVLGQFHRPPL